MTKKITLYTDDGEQSALARIYLKELNVVFEEVNVKEHRNKSIKINTRRLPFLVVKGSGVSTVAGFDEFLYASALDHGLSYDEFVRRKKNVEVERQSKLP